MVLYANILVIVIWDCKINWGEEAHISAWKDRNVKLCWEAKYYRQVEEQASSQLAFPLE